jgi:hypothetical protein
MQMVQADSRKSGDFRVRENFLAGFDSDHGLGPSLCLAAFAIHTVLDAACIVLAAQIQEQ